MVAGLVSCEASPVLGLQMVVFSLCPQVVFVCVCVCVCVCVHIPGVSFCVRISSSYKALLILYWGRPQWLNGKESACNAGDTSLILGLGRSSEEDMATHSNILT